MKGKGIGKNNNQYWKDYQSYMAGINGYSAGDISSKDFDKLIQDTTKMAEEQAKLRLQLENEVANQVTKIRNDLAKNLRMLIKLTLTQNARPKLKQNFKHVQIMILLLLSKLQRLSLIHSETTQRRKSKY